MKTPITDARAWGDDFDSPAKAREFARRLELDRAALMEALERVTNGFYSHNTGYFHADQSDVTSARAALVAARANFPDED